MCRAHAISRAVRPVPHSRILNCNANAKRSLRLQPILLDHSIGQISVSSLTWLRTAHQWWAKATKMVNITERIKECASSNNNVTNQSLTEFLGSRMRWGERRVNGPCSSWHIL